MGYRAKDRASFAVTFVLAAAVLTAFVVAWQVGAYNDKREHFDSLAESRVNTMHENLGRIVSTTSVLEALVIANDGDTSFFEDEAPVIYEQAVKNTGVKLRNVVLAPNGVVTDVYPVEGNEQLVGFDFYDESKAGNKSAIEARDTNSLVLTDPFELVQGGLGVGARQPVEVQVKSGIAARKGVSTDKGSKKKAWGLVTATLDFDDLIEVLDFDALDKAGANYRLWYTNGDGEEVLITSSETLPSDAITHTLSTMGVEWNLDISPQEGWVNWWSAAAGEGVALIAAVLLAFLVYSNRRTRRANETLRRLANLDSLTSCYSRHFVNTILVNQLTGEWNDPAMKCSLAIVDIDRFKGINDTYGHDVGDKAIVTIADILKANCCPEDGDCVVRHGGDEFVIVYNDVTAKRFRDKLDTIAQQVRDARIEGVPDLRLTVSLGGEHYESREVSRYYDMLSRADKKLYDAKEGGRDLVVI